MNITIISVVATSLFVHVSVDIRHVLQHVLTVHNYILQLNGTNKYVPC